MPARVGLVGPLHPHRGGIAHHSTQLLAELRARTDVHAESFARLYPRALAPGGAPRDPGLALPPGVHEELDSLSPPTWRRAARRLRGGRLYVFPWWTPVLAPVLGSLAWARRREGARVVAVVHNLLPHEPLPGAALATRAVLGAAHGLVAATEGDAAALRARFPGARVRCAPHPLPDAAAPLAALPRRAPLELLFFGFVRPYKGLDTLYAALRLVPELDLALSVVGEAWGPEPPCADPRVERVARYVGEAEAAACFARADVVVLPYRAATGSGVVPQALRHGRPVLATRVGGLPEQVEEGRTGWLVPPEDPAALAAALRRVAASDLRLLAPALAARAGALDPGRLAEAVLDLGAP